MIECHKCKKIAVYWAYSALHPPRLTCDEHKGKDYALVTKESK